MIRIYDRKKLKIAFIGGRGLASQYSGIETYYEEVGKGLAESGHELHVYCRSYFTPRIQEHHGMRVIRIPTLVSKHFETFIHTMLSTVHAIFCNYDIVHYHALGPSLFSFIPRMFGMKTVVTVQGLDWQRQKWNRVASRFLKICEWTSIEFPNATIVVSRFLQMHYDQKYHKLTYYVPNGVCVPKKRMASEILGWGLEPQKYILFLGRLSPEKNCHLLISAYLRIKTDVKLIFAGGSSYTDEYIRELKKHESDMIRFLGYVRGDPLEELLSNALLFVLPSTIEGISIALLEAMSYGNCVLASDIPENRELVHDVGFCFRSGSEDDLVRMIGLLLSDDKTREESGRKAEELVTESYQWSMVAAETEKVYNKVLSKNKQRGDH